MIGKFESAHSRLVWIRLVLRAPNCKHWKSCKSKFSASGWRKWIASIRTLRVHKSSGWNASRCLRSVWVVEVLLSFVQTYRNVIGKSLAERAGNNIKGFGTQLRPRHSHKPSKVFKPNWKPRETYETRFWALRVLTLHHRKPWRYGLVMIIG